MAKRLGDVAFTTGAGCGQGRKHALRLAAEGPTSSRSTSVQPIDDPEYPAGTETEFKETIAAVEGLAAGSWPGRATQY